MFVRVCVVVVGESDIHMLQSIDHARINHLKIGFHDLNGLSCVKRGLFYSKPFLNKAEIFAAVVEP